MLLLTARVIIMYEQDLARPDEEDVEANLKATKAIIDARVSGTIAAAQPKSLAPKAGAAQFIKYTPAKQVRLSASSVSREAWHCAAVCVDRTRVLADYERVAER